MVLKAQGCDASIMNPANNLRLGAAYLHDMLGRFNGQVALASAAYNAGPERVANWRPRQTLPADVWIENSKIAELVAPGTKLGTADTTIDAKG